MTPDRVGVVRAALVSALAQGIAVEGGATFDWVRGAWPRQEETGLPRAVNWIGALLWATRDPLTGRLSRPRALAAVGDPDPAWVYRFGYGFNQGRALSVVDPETMRVVGEDGVSAAAARLAREFGA